MLYHNMTIFVIAIFASGLSAAAVPHHIKIDCGGAAHRGGHWLQEGSSTVSTVKGDLVTTAGPVPYNSAQISHSRFSYSLKLSPGQKILRLHFHPSSYTGFESSNDLFSVEAGNSSLLANFSASVTARALAVNVVVKQFCVAVEENETLNLVFSPEWENSYYAFVNEIEIISIPCCDGGVALNPIIHVDNSTALERVHYQHVKWGPVSSGDDIASMFGMWSNQPSVGEDAEIGTNKTWRVSVDAGFKYLVRLHLCEAGLHMDFVLLINGRVALTSADMLQQRRGNRELFWYNNYMVMVDKGDISISLHSRHEFLDRHGPLEGFEVFKTSSHQSDNLLIQTQYSPSWTLLLHLILHDHKRFLICIVSLFHICFTIFLEYKSSKFKFSLEDNKPSSRAKKLNHSFSPAGKCEYGGVSRKFVDYGKEIAGIKPLKKDSKQRENKFQTVVEALWDLGHVNLVCFIGFCREKQEVILVNKYISSVTLSDQLDKLARKSNDFFPQSWKHRSEICIGISRALEHLRSPTVIHRDLKPANIMLDDKFVAKLSDFGIAKSFSESQTHNSTKVTLTFENTAPDIITTSELTKQSGINSFGVLVLRELCGRSSREPLREEDKCSLTTLAERTEVDDVDYDKSQEENMNLIVPTIEIIDFDNIVSEISFLEGLLHTLCPREDFHLGERHFVKVNKGLYNEKSSENAEVGLGLLMTGSEQQMMPQGFQFYPTDVKKRVCRLIEFFRVHEETCRIYKRFMESESDQDFREWQVKLGVLMDSSTGSQKCQMPPGFQFQPTDVELLERYLQKKLASTRSEIDHYNYDPWDHPIRSFFKENEGLFFSKWDRKRAWCTSRYQKATGMHKLVTPRGQTNWTMMREYMLRAARGMALLHAVEKPFICRERITEMKRIMMPRGQTKWTVMHEYTVGASAMALLNAVTKPFIYREHIIEMQRIVMPRGQTKWTVMREDMVGAARGMGFWHVVEEPVICREFKASIMLLDELFEAKQSALATVCFKKSNPLKELQVKLGDLMDSLTSSQQWQIPPEIRLHPTDEDYGHFISFFNNEPRDLSKSSIFGEQEWFFSLRDRERATSGHHKATGMHDPAVPKGITEWAMMLEYMQEDDTNCPHRQYNDWLKHMIMIEYPPSTIPLQKLTFKSHWS